MTDTFGYGVVMSGVVGSAEQYFPTAREAWDYLITRLEKYVDDLETAGLTNQHADWDVFLDEVKAVSLRPWTEEQKLEGPDGKWYGVESEI